MASIKQDPESKMFRISFRIGDKQWQKSLKTQDPKEAEEKLGAIENTLRAIREGWLTIPPEADAWTFISTGGRITNRTVVASAPAPEVLTLEKLWEKYVEMLPAGTMDDDSLTTRQLHFSHLKRILGKDRDVQSLTPMDMQGYVNKRMQEKKANGDPIQSQTIRKETGALGTVWQWAVVNNLLAGEPPVGNKKVRYDKKAEEKLPFMTWSEIEHRVAQPGLTQKQIDDLWDCLFLDTQQTAELLAYVKEHAAFAFIYPMFVFVAHTGARRAEMRRSLLMDLDFIRGHVVLREKKRERDKKFTLRRVPMSPLFREVMQAWVKNHPGGPYTFCQVTTRMKKRDKPEPLTKNVARHHFDHTLADSKWKVIRGFHVLRHSFASNLAAAGVPQDDIDEWMGHQTREMRKRYRHLFPEKSRQQIESVYGR